MTPDEKCTYIACNYHISVHWSPLRACAVIFLYFDLKASAITEYVIFLLFLREQQYIIQYFCIVSLMFQRLKRNFIKKANSCSWNSISGSLCSDISILIHIPSCFIINISISISYVRVSCHQHHHDLYTQSNTGRQQSCLHFTVQIFLGINCER